jgi:hypothetical protein
MRGSAGAILAQSIAKAVQRHSTQLLREARVKMHAATDSPNIQPDGRIELDVADRFWPNSNGVRGLDYQFGSQPAL